MNMWKSMQNELWIMNYLREPLKLVFHKWLAEENLICKIVFSKYLKKLFNFA